MEKLSKLQAERLNFQKKIEILQSTEGYEKLTLKQQRFIILSLYLQDRAERSESFQVSINDNFREIKPDDTYLDSINLIENWFCHGAIDALERPNNSTLEPREEYDKSFFDASYFPIDNVQEAELLLNGYGYPCVVHINSHSKNKGRLTQEHSFLALGHDHHNNIVIWEKEGYGCPFRLATLKDEFKEYGNNTYWWGLRQLKSINQE